MTDIPEDIMRAARDVALEAMPDNWSTSHAAEVIARAILAERERCAQIAETCPDEPYAKHGQWHGTLRKSIAAAIRSPERAGE